MEFSFRKLDPSDVSVVLNWLKKPHIQEFWNNSKENHDDIKHFAEERKIRPYHGEIYSYWLGAIDNDIFCMIMTFLTFIGITYCRTK